MKNYLIILFCVLQGCNSAAQDSTLCDKYNLASADLILEFEMYGDTTKLDSALHYTELALSCCPHKNYANLIGRKLGILSLQHDYDAGIELISTLEDPFLWEIPYYNSVLLKRFYAMKSLYQGDTVTYKQYVHSILEEITPFIIEHQATLDTLCKNDLSTIFKNSLSFAQIQYYYYKSIVESSDTISKELDLLKQKGYEHRYIRFIEAVFEKDFLFYQIF